MTDPAAVPLSNTIVAKSGASITLIFRAQSAGDVNWVSGAIDDGSGTTKAISVAANQSTFDMPAGNNDLNVVLLPLVSESAKFVYTIGTDPTENVAVDTGDISLFPGIIHLAGQ
jgi:hypothetical protein